jgi:hypothetical protein
VTGALRRGLAEPSRWAKLACDSSTSLAGNATAFADRSAGPTTQREASDLLQVDRKLFPDPAQDRAARARAQRGPAERSGATKRSSSGSPCDDIPNAYARAALDRACAAIIAAPCGAQEMTLHRECFSIGGLIAAGALTGGPTVARLVAAAERMPAHWGPWGDLNDKVLASVKRGMDYPRGAPNPRPAALTDQTDRKRPLAPVCVTTTADALRVWDEGVDPRGTAAAELYLRERKLAFGDDLAGEVLRWHPRLNALMALFRSIATGEPRAISRIFLDPDGRKIERRYLGPVAGGAVMLDPQNAVAAASELHVSEGIETGMAARQFGLKPTWALGDANGIEQLAVFSGVKRLILHAEHCPRNARAIQVCGRRWAAAGREVLIASPTIGKDLNDALIGTAP